MEDKYLLKPMLLLALFKLEKISPDFFKSELGTLSVPDLILMRGRIDRGEDIVKDLLDKYGIKVEGNSEEGAKDEVPSEKDVVDIVEMTLLNKLNLFPPEEIAHIAYDLDDYNTKNVLLEAFSDSIEEKDLGRLMKLVNEFPDLDLHEEIAFALEDILRIRTRTNVIFEITKEIPEVIEDKFFERLKDELEDCDESELVHIIQNAEYTLAEEALTIVLSRLSMYSTEGLIIFLNNAYKAKKEQGAVALLRKEVGARIKNESPRMLVERMRTIEDESVINDIIFNQLYYRHEEVSALLEELND